MSIVDDALLSTLRSYLKRTGFEEAASGFSADLVKKLATETRENAHANKDECFREVSSIDTTSNSSNKITRRSPLNGFSKVVFYSRLFLDTSICNMPAARWFEATPWYRGFG